MKLHLGAEDEVVGGVGGDGDEVWGGTEEGYWGQSGAKDFTGDCFKQSIAKHLIEYSLIL